MIHKNFIKGLIAMFTVFTGLTIMTYIGVVFLGYGFNPYDWSKDDRAGITEFYASMQVLGAFITVMAHFYIVKNEK